MPFPKKIKLDIASYVLWVLASHRQRSSTARPKARAEHIPPEALPKWRKLPESFQRVVIRTLD